MTKKLKIALITSLLVGSFSCIYAGWFDSKPAESDHEQRFKDNLKLYMEACEKGDFSSCNEAGSYHDGGRGTERNSDKAKELYEKACNGGNLYGCTNLKLSENISKKSTQLNEALKNCNAGSVDQCGRLGVLYLKGEGVSQNLDLAEKYLQQSCHAGYDKWCGSLGGIHYEKKDYFEAFKYINKSCAAKDSESCWAIGKLYENGEGTRLDIVKAADFYGKSCDLKYQKGCDDYKRLKSSQPVQQVSNNNSNSDYQRQQLEIQRQQLKALQDQADATRRAGIDAEFANSPNMLNQQLQNIQNNNQMNQMINQQNINNNMRRYY